MTQPARPSVEATLGDHERRLRALEASCPQAIDLSGAGTGAGGASALVARPSRTRTVADHERRIAALEAVACAEFEASSFAASTGPGRTARPSLGEGLGSHERRIRALEATPCCEEGPVEPPPEPPPTRTCGPYVPIGLFAYRGFSADLFFIRRSTATGRLEAGFAGAGDDYLNLPLLVIVGPVVGDREWFRVEMKLDVNSDPYVMNWAVDLLDGGGLLVQTPVSHARTQPDEWGGFVIGGTGGGLPIYEWDGIIALDDWVLSKNAADYPFGDGYCRGLRANELAASSGLAQFKTQAGAAPTSSNEVDDTPGQTASAPPVADESDTIADAGDGDWVAQIGPLTTLDSLTWGFENFTIPGGQEVESVTFAVAVHALTNRRRIFQQLLPLYGGGGSAAARWLVPGFTGTVDTYRYRAGTLSDGEPIAVPAGGWTATRVNGLQVVQSVRSNDGGAAPSDGYALDQIMLQLSVTLDPSSRGILDFEGFEWGTADSKLMNKGGANIGGSSNAVAIPASFYPGRSTGDDGFVCQIVGRSSPALPTDPPLARGHVGKFERSFLLAQRFYALVDCAGSAPPPTVAAGAGLWVTWGLSTGQFSAGSLAAFAVERGYAALILEIDDFDNAARAADVKTACDAAGLAFWIWSSRPAPGTAEAQVAAANPVGIILQAEGAVDWPAVCSSFRAAYPTLPAGVVTNFGGLEAVYDPMNPGATPQLAALHAADMRCYFECVLPENPLATIPNQDFQAQQRGWAAADRTPVIYVYGGFGFDDYPERTGYPDWSVWDAELIP